MGFGKGKDSGKTKDSDKKDTRTRGSGWVYCNCVGSHKASCENNKPGGFPPHSR